MRRRHDSSSKPAPSRKADAAALPRSTAELRSALARKIAMAGSDWRRCPRPLCRRARQCSPPELDCLAPPRRTQPLSAQQEARIMANIKRALRRRLEELRDAAGGGENA